MKLVEIVQYYIQLCFIIIIINCDCFCVREALVRLVKMETKVHPERKANPERVPAIQE